MSESVRVVVRCRPLNSRENSLKCKVVIDVDENKNQIQLYTKGRNKNDPKNSSQETPKCFTFDGTYGDDSKTSNIYAESAASLVESVVDGFNATVFAYGQTGCGKSYTMEGSEMITKASSLNVNESNEAAGIIPRACSDLFDSVALSTAQNTNKNFLVHASYLEIYNENVRDLLTQDTSVKHLELKEHPDKGVYVKGLSMHRITSALDAQRLMAKGWKNRVTGVTLMNQDSSRSHAIFTMYVETSENDNIKAGKLHLVDLAGSERQSKTKATGIRLKEAAKINLSLSTLGNVISALVDGKATHIPYRNSKLTRILQDSLGGNTKTLMVACISPADNNYEETLSTLRYANRAKKIKNAPRINEDPKDALLRQYQEEILELKKLLQGQLGTDGLKQMLTKGKFDQILQNIDQPTITVTDSLDLNASLDLQAQLDEALKIISIETKKRQELESEIANYKENLNFEPKIDEISSVTTKHTSPTLINLENRQIEKVQIDNMTKNLTTLIEPVETSEIQPASKEHERHLKRLLQLQKGFVRNLPISQEALENIKNKKIQIKHKQLAAEKRRELAKKAVEAKDDEEMFHALFENVHEDVRIQKRQLDKAKELIKQYKEEIQDLKDEFSEERNTMLENSKEKGRENLLLESIIDKIQPLIKREYNYSNIDKIKKEASFNEETEKWQLPKLSLKSENLDQSNTSLPGVSYKPTLSARQLKLLGNQSTNQSESNLNFYSDDNSINSDTFREIGRKLPRKLQPLKKLK